MTFALRFGNSDSANEFKEQFTAAQKVVESLMAGEAPEPAAEAEEAAPATEEAAADPSTDAAADALQNLSVGTGAEEAAPAEKA
ncbi:unnamed protein product [Ectocarpus sp. 8 AP-2014]